MNLGGWFEWSEGTIKGATGGIFNKKHPVEKIFLQGNQFSMRQDSNCSQRLPHKLQERSWVEESGMAFFEL